VIPEQIKIKLKTEIMRVVYSTLIQYAVLIMILLIIHNDNL